MKKIYFILNILCILTLMSACNNDDDNLGAVVSTAPIIGPLGNTTWVLTQPEAGENPYLFRLAWSKARFSYEAGGVAYVDSVSYQVEVDLFENDFATPVVLDTTSNLYSDLYTVQLNNAIAKLLSKEDETTHDIKFRIKATYKGGEPQYSQPVSAIVTPYIYREAHYIYIIGDMNGWDNRNTDYIMFRNDNDTKSGVYTYTGYFAKNPSEGSYFKFCAEENLGSYDNMYCAGANGTLEMGDKGAFFAGPGYFTVTIDVKNMTWTIVPYDASAAKTYFKIGPIGDFCGWDNEPALTKSTYDGHQWHGGVTFQSSTACKFRGNNDWVNNWGGAAGDLPYGKSVFDGPGTAVQKAGNYSIYFNDLTGHYVIKNNK